MTSDANASDAKLKEAAAAPGAWRVVDWKVRGGEGGLLIRGAPAASCGGITNGRAEGGVLFCFCLRCLTIGHDVLLPGRQKHLSYSSVAQLEGTANVWELCFVACHDFTLELLCTALPVPFGGSFV